jgi:Uma2 family endonuclease
MEATLRLQRRASYADYMAAEQNSDHRHEFIDGVIVAMASGSDEHNAIAGRLARLLGNRETGSCRYYTPDQRFWIAARARGRYADGSIICGPPEHPAHDDQATTNPTVVIEVRSPSSEGDDDGDKRSDFQSLASVEAYLLVAQDQRRVKVYRRVGGDWSTATYGDGDSFELPTLSAAIQVADIYNGILDGTGRSLLRSRETR